MNKKKRRRKNKTEYSKRWVAIIMIVTLLDINLCIILDRMESLAIALATEVVAVFGGYMVKAYLGKRNEEKNKLLDDVAMRINEEEESCQ